MLVHKKFLKKLNDFKSKMQCLKITLLESTDVLKTCKRKQNSSTWLRKLILVVIIQFKANVSSTVLVRNVSN